jgi:hypothetical protein
MRTAAKQQNHSWATYRPKGTPALFVGIVYDQPDEQSAIKKVPVNQRDRLIASRRD